MADLSIIIVTRNTCALTRAAVRSVMESKDALTKEIVVVDNGSSDGTPAMLSGEFPAVKCLRQENNLGFARANNFGAGAATGEFLLLLNSDARLQPDTLAPVVDWMRRHPECGVAGVQLINPDGSRQNSIANFPSLATELLNKSLLRRLFPKRFPGKEHSFPEPLEVESVVGACMFIRSEAWKVLGGFDDRYFFFFEETDFCLRARRRGWKVFHLPQARVWHEQGTSVKQLSAAARIEYWRSRYAYFQKNHGRITRAVLVMGLGLRLIAGWLANLLAVLLSLGTRAGLRDKCRAQTALLKWHLQGRPAAMGLPR
ncbi:MAG: glycosyltransferase family 2 protein [Verrucomicrobiia bacterium]|jgi:GT2 family glycosyltransferase